MLKLFISSTRQDLGPHRTALREALGRIDVKVWGMEERGAESAEPLTASLDWVAQADVVVGVYGSRYGFIPTDGYTSITEREYDEARRLGKRTLCYTAQAPTTGEQAEPADAQERLQAFKARIDRELVRGEFSGPEQLATLVVADLARVLAEEPLGIGFDAVASNWAIHEREVLARLASDDSHAADDSASPLEREWNAFVDQPAWRTRIANTGALIAEAAGKFDETAGIAVAARALSYDADDHVVRAALPKVASPAHRAIVDRLIARLSADLARSRSDATPTGRPGFAGAPSDRKSEERLRTRLHEARSLEHHLRTFVHEAETPTFNRALLVLGGMGTGKTFALASRLGPADVDPARRFSFDDLGGQLVLPLERGAFGVPLGERIRGALAEASGVRWRSLEEFDRFLLAASRRDERREPPKLVIVIDDLNRGYSLERTPATDLEDLMAFVAQRTALRTFHWFILAHDASYTRLIAPKGATDFWRLYGWRPDDATPKVAQWISLDDLTRMDQTGLRIISTHRRPPSGAADADDSSDDLPLRESTVRMFSNPFVAWILVELSKDEELSSLFALNWVVFVRTFWERRQARLDLSGLSREDLDLAVALVSRALGTLGVRPLKAALLDALAADAKPVSASLGNPAGAAQALQALQDGSLLRTVRLPSTQYSGVNVEHLELRVELFWAWRLAMQWIGDASTETGVLASGPIWTRLVGIIDGELREASAMFALLLLDSEPRDRSATALRDLSHQAALHTDTAGAAVWLAGAKASERLQAELMDILRDDRLSPDVLAATARAPRNIFAFLHFIGEASVSVLGVPKRLSLVRPVYDAIASAGLQAYFLLILQRLMALVADTSQWGRTVLALDGAERLGISESLGTACYDGLKAILTTDEESPPSHEDLTEPMIACLKRVSDQVPTGGTDRFFVWQWVVTSHCRAVVGQMGLEAFDHFWSAGWYRPTDLGIGRAASRQMRREANLALAFWYRGRHSSREQERARKDYLQLVRRLSESGELGQREIAYFLIRHTARIQRRRQPSQVDREFGPVLTTLRTDPGLADVVKDYPVEIIASPG